VLLSGLRRLLILFVVLFVLTSTISLAIGGVAHASLAHAVADGFYAVGVAVLIASFVFGLRGPLRGDPGEATEADALERPVPSPFGIGAIVPRSIRRTTLDERQDARRSSIALFALGLVLILIGAGFDPSRHVF
jgi:hypothetical protein